MLDRLRALGRLRGVGRPGHARPARRRHGHRAAVGGQGSGRPAGVRTVLAGPRQSDRPARRMNAAAAIEAAGRGDVLVIANAGRTDVSCWGGILTLAATRQALGGVVIDGACRDIAETRGPRLPGVRPGGGPGQRARPDRAAGRWAEPVVARRGHRAPGGRGARRPQRRGVRSGRRARPGDRRSPRGCTAREAAMADAVLAGQPVTEVMHDSRFPAADDAP